MVCVLRHTDLKASLPDGFVKSASSFLSNISALEKLGIIWAPYFHAQSLLELAKSLARSLQFSSIVKLCDSGDSTVTAELPKRLASVKDNDTQEQCKKDIIYYSMQELHLVKEAKVKTLFTSTDALRKQECQFDEDTRGQISRSRSLLKSALSC